MTSPYLSRPLRTEAEARQQTGKDRKMIESSHDGGPAFPHGKYMKHKVTGAFDTYAHGGMSLRDYFAGQALAGLCANPDLGSSVIFSEDRPDETIAEMAYTVADALIAQRGGEDDPA